MFDELRPSNVEVNNISNFIPYYVGHHGLLLAAEEFYDLSSLYKIFKKQWIQKFGDKISLVIKFYRMECEQ